jgi:response regulator of citrate/malate metabolism
MLRVTLRVLWFGDLKVFLVADNDDLAVLIVDDDFMVADVHRRLVEREQGFRVVGVVHNATDAFRFVQQERVDLLLLDIYLPDHSGLELLAKLRAQRIPVDVLVVSAARDRDTVQEAVRLGCVHFLIKPFDAATLHERLLAFKDFRVPTSSQVVTQQAIDRSLSLLRPSHANDKLPKGLSQITLQLVLDVVSPGHELGASEVAAEAGISRVSARRYLEYLAEKGVVEVKPRYGTTGRPELRYRWSNPISVETR